MTDDPFEATHCDAAISVPRCRARHGSRGGGPSIVPKSETVEVDISKLPAAIPLFDVISENTPATEALAEFRERTNTVLFTRPVRLKTAAGKTEAVFDIPRVKTGLYVADLWLTQGGRVVNWASVPVKITGPEYIAAVVPEKESFARGEPIRGTVRLQADLPVGAALRVELRDPHGRIVQRVELKPDGREVAWTLELKHPLSRVYAVSASIVDDRGVLQQREAYVDTA